MEEEALRCSGTKNIYHVFPSCVTSAEHFDSHDSGPSDFVDFVTNFHEYKGFE
jgi:hypothetical protein